MPEGPTDQQAGPWISETLALLDEGSLPAIALDPRDRVVLAVNGTLADALGVDASELEDEAVHAIVDEKHHGLVDAILDALAEGANLGPTPVALRGPHREQPRASLWARVPGVHEIAGSSLVLLCRPFPEAEGEGRDPLNPEGYPGFGRIPPSPSWEN